MSDFIKGVILGSGCTGFFIVLLSFTPGHIVHMYKKAESDCEKSIPADAPRNIKCKMKFIPEVQP